MPNNQFQFDLNHFSRSTVLNEEGVSQLVDSYQQIFSKYQLQTTKTKNSANISTKYYSLLQGEVCPLAREIFIPYTLAIWLWVCWRYELHHQHQRKPSASKESLGCLASRLVDDNSQKTGEQGSLSFL